MASVRILTSTVSRWKIPAVFCTGDETCLTSVYIVITMVTVWRTS